MTYNSVIDPSEKTTTPIQITLQELGHIYSQTPLTPDNNTASHNITLHLFHNTAPSLLIYTLIRWTIILPQTYWCKTNITYCSTKQHPTPHNIIYSWDLNIYTHLIPQISCGQHIFCSYDGVSLLLWWQSVLVSKCKLPHYMIPVRLASTLSNLEYHFNLLLKAKHWNKPYYFMLDNKTEAEWQNKNWK